jgi:tetratricopeptide (TPR) repeat protein
MTSTNWLCVGAAAIWLFAAAGGIASAVAASPLDDPALGGRNRYDRCLAIVKQDAARAATTAADWYHAGGGSAALHCEALALAGTKRYPEAAAKLEEAAAGETKALALRAQLLDQAGNAWLLGGDTAKAENAFTAALALQPKDEDLLSDRARERGAARTWSGAFDDLTAVLAIDPDRADVYVLRASALHAEGHKAEAWADIAHALDIYPGYPEALVERGAMRLEAGNRGGARADWQEAAKEAPDSDAGAAAQAHLAALSVNTRPSKH